MRFHPLSLFRTPLRPFLWFLILGTGVLASCASAPDLVALGWNVQNLCDATDDGTEYPEFDPGLGRWNERAYQARLLALGRAIKSVRAAGPDLMVLLEVENQRVLDDLVRTAFPLAGYRFVRWFGLKGASMGMGILSRHPLLSVRVHGLAYGGQDLRPVVECLFDTGGASLRLLANHWKSRLGNPSASAAARLLASDLVRRLLASPAGAAVTLVMGDLNEVPGGPALPWAASPGPVGTGTGSPPEVLAPAPGPASLLVPLAIAPLWPGGPAVPPASTAPRPPVLADPPSPRLQGSYAWRGSWERIDHIFVALADPAAWTARSGVLAPGGSLDSRGLPWRYDPRSGRGLSDHLPIVLELRRSKRV